MRSDVHDGVKVYTPWVLKTYDLVVIRFSNRFVWRCPSSIMLSQYRKQLGASGAHRHLDVGPGTGWYLMHSVSPSTDLELMDLNEHTMRSTLTRLGSTPHSTAIHEHNILEPLPADLGTFDSIALNYVLHCVPGSFSDKGVAFAHLGEHLSADGTIFGATILGSGVRHNRVGKRLMDLYNRKGIFHNQDDDEAGLRQVLSQSFEDVHIEVTGTVALFSASRPRSA